MSSFPIEPLGDLVFIVPESEDGLKIASIDARTSLRGRVVAVGPGLPLPEGGYLPCDVKVGDIVRLSPGRTIEAVFNQQRTWITRESTLLAVEEAA
jgi:co-chaperonin GroES (HSP10)